MTTWRNIKKVLCVRLDNMGDVLLSTPAMAALKETFGCHLTLLTSTRGAGIVPHIPVIDDVLVFDAPWVGQSAKEPADIGRCLQQLRAGAFDAAVIFTVYSQSALPAAMLLWQAGIPLRLAYCRENPYTLLSDWLPDPEPYTFVQHQVLRDLALVRSIGASTTSTQLRLSVTNAGWRTAWTRAAAQSLALQPQRYIVLHPGVSEPRRAYPVDEWVALAQLLSRRFAYPIIVTGAASEVSLCEQIVARTGAGTSLAGALPLEAHIAMVHHSALVISVNTVTAHIASAAGVRLVVLYAATNPQHGPWKTHSAMLPFPPPGAPSRNEVVRYARQRYFASPLQPLKAPAVFSHACRLLASADTPARVERAGSETNLRHTNTAIKME